MLELGAGFMAVFGPIYLNRVTSTLGFRVAAQHLNPVNVCNGGAMATFADTQIAAVHRGAGSSDGHAPTISLSLDYIGTAPNGAWVEAAVTLLKQTRSMIFTQALITTDGQLVARSNAIYRHYTASPGAHKA